jgi:hypothetical protein
MVIAVPHNVGLPWALSFGPEETIELFRRFYAVFVRDFEIDPGVYILESDQGAALHHVGKRHPRHLFCLRHVLRSLHRDGSRFASLIGDFISARTEKELYVLMEP